MPAGQARPRTTPGAIQLVRKMRTIMRVDILNPVMLAYTMPTLGAFLI